jgi:lipid A 3-O-deacylase
LGFLGVNSFGEETQKRFHKFFSYKEVYGCETQVTSALAVQTHFLFLNKLLPKLNSDEIDFNFQSEAHLGTIFTSVTAGFLTRIGFKKLGPIFDSNLLGAAVTRRPEEVGEEFYLYLAPSISYQLYDATTQGSLFNDNSAVTFDLIPIRFNGEVGFKYRKNNLNLSYAFVYRSKELHNQINTAYFYGSILVSYLLK